MEQFDKYQRTHMKRCLVRIARSVRKHSSISPDDFVDSDRSEVITARHLAMYLSVRFSIADHKSVADFYQVSKPLVTYALQRTREYLKNPTNNNAWVKEVANKVIGEL